jgi:NtrC-family two-component system response regulator AlgB
MAKLLIVDAKWKIWKKLRTLFESSGHDVARVNNSLLAIKLLMRDEFDLVLCDRHIAKANGYEFLREVRRIAPDTSIIVTSDGFRQASNTLPAGLWDYVTTLSPTEEIEQLIAEALNIQRTRFRTHVLRDTIDDALFLQSRSPAMRHLLENAQQAAASNATILLTGESGTGKTLLARQIHLWSPRRTGPFVIIDRATLSQQLRQQEVFGRAMKAMVITATKNKAPLEGAEGGTVFLEDVGDLPAALQPPLARLVQDHTLNTAKGEKAVDIRIIAAASHDLLPDIAAHRFYDKLFYSLNIISLRIPALRERSLDIIPLARRMLAVAAVRNRRSDLRISNEAAAAMACYRWPGNVRELRNAVEGAAVLCEGDTITLAHLPEAISKLSRNVARPAPSRASLDEIEREHIVRALADSETLEDAAMRLGIDVSTLRRKRKRYKLDPIIGSKV